MNIVVVYSGGLDSTVLLYHLLSQGHGLRALAFAYGQRHAGELSRGRAIARGLGIDFRIFPVPGFAALFARSALLTEDDLPTGEYSADNLAATTVPNRNMVLLSIAAGWAWSIGFDAVAYGAHASRTVTYPDCTPEFAEAADRACRAGNSPEVRVLAPFVRLHKADIVRLGHELGVPFAQTWSCYRGGAVHCGACTTCTDRRRAFAEAGVEDPTEYDLPEQPA